MLLIAAVRQPDKDMANSGTQHVAFPSSFTTTIPTTAMSSGFSRALPPPRQVQPRGTDVQSPTAGASCLSKPAKKAYTKGRTWAGLPELFYQVTQGLLALHLPSLAAPPCPLARYQTANAYYASTVLADHLGAERSSSSYTRLPGFGILFFLPCLIQPRLALRRLLVVLSRHVLPRPVFPGLVIFRGRPAYRSYRKTHPPPPPPSGVHPGYHHYYPLPQGYQPMMYPSSAAFHDTLRPPM
ncbi:hypothetical protein R3P38DRAFT_3213936 [Favolaschia claudopus]|uniref:Uncharacterized protein n=1 Tax=Favolaschia claudopus TaxID=2862362 RepID=A0AAW0ACI7_9AGAR